VGLKILYADRPQSMMISCSHNTLEWNKRSSSLSEKWIQFGKGRKEERYPEK